MIANEPITTTRQTSKQLATELKSYLEQIQYDQINQLIRGSDYHLYPFPFDAHQLIMHDLQSGYLTRNQLITPQQETALRFFLMGDPISMDIAREHLSPALITQGLQHHIFVQNDQQLQTNNLCLTSKQLLNGQTIYFMADLPAHYPERDANNQVYANHDSYLLHEHLKSQQISTTAKTVLELGSGSGFQLIALCKLHSQIQECYGLEISPRAEAISQFNIQLNNLEDRIKIINSEGNIPYSDFELIISNPPFLPCPESVEVAGTRINLQETMPLAGYGGIDGMETTGIFLKIIEERMSSAGEAKIFGQFAYNTSGEYALAESLQGLKLNASLRLYYGKDSLNEELSDISVTDMSQNTAMLLLHDRIVTRDEYPKLQRAIETTFARHGIAGSTTAIVTCKAGTGNLRLEKTPCFQNALEAFPHRRAPVNL